MTTSLKQHSLFSHVSIHDVRRPRQSFEPRRTAFVVIAIYGIVRNGRDPELAASSSLDPVDKTLLCLLRRLPN